MKLLPSPLSVFRSIFILLILSGWSAKAQTFSSSNLPIVVINTNGSTIVDEPKIKAHMGIIDNGPGVLNNVNDPFNNYNGGIGIEKRGSSSQQFPKAQYGIELWDKNGLDSTASLLGMPTEEDWILFAPYNDKALMRDVLAYRMARMGGRYAPRTVFCELVLNGAYQGIYVLMEKIKRDKNRVDISKLEPTEVSGDDLTGGYILKIDKLSGNGGDGFNSAYPPPNGSYQRIYFQYDYPEPENIAPEQRNYIQKYVSDFETALKGQNFKDVDFGYRRYIDVPSFIDFMIVNEASKNVDGYRLSTYLFKPKSTDGGKLNMGPVWDFNLGFGNANYCTSGDPQGFVLSFNSLCSGDQWLIPFWWSRLQQDPSYVSALRQRWKELREGPYQTEKLITYIDSVATVLNQGAQQRNFQRWPVLGTYIWPNYFVGGSFSEEVQWLKNWVTTRMNWLDVQWSVDFATSAEKDETEDRISVYPNPSAEQWQIKYYTDRPGVVNVQVADLHGKLLRSKDKKQTVAGEGSMTIHVRDLPEGMYILRLKLPGEAWTVKKVLKGQPGE